MIMVMLTCKVFVLCQHFVELPALDFAIGFDRIGWVG
jgi:hypothetical protein